MNYFKFSRLTFLLSLLTITTISAADPTSTRWEPVTTVLTTQIGTNPTCAAGNSLIPFDGTTFAACDNNYTDNFPILTKSFVEVASITTYEVRRTHANGATDHGCGVYKMFFGLKFVNNAGTMNIIPKHYCSSYPNSDLSDNIFCDDTRKYRTLLGECIAEADCTYGAWDGSGNKFFRLKTGWHGNFCIKYAHISKYAETEFVNQATFEEKLKTAKIMETALQDLHNVMIPTTTDHYDNAWYLISATHTRGYFDYVLVGSTAAVTQPAMKVNISKIVANNKISIFPVYFDTNAGKVFYNVCLGAVLNATVLGVTCDNASYIASPVIGANAVRLHTPDVTALPAAINTSIYISKTACIKTLYLAQRATVDSCVLRFNAETIGDVPAAQIVNFSTGLAQGAPDGTCYTFLNGCVNQATCLMIDNGTALNKIDGTTCVACATKSIIDHATGVVTCAALDAAKIEYIPPIFQFISRYVDNHNTNCNVFKHMFATHTITAKTSCITIKELTLVDTTNAAFKIIVGDNGMSSMGDITGKFPVVNDFNNYTYLNTKTFCKNFYHRIMNAADTDCITITSCPVVFRQNDRSSVCKAAKEAANFQRSTGADPKFEYAIAPNFWYGDAAKELKPFSDCSTANHYVVFKHNATSTCEDKTASAPATEYNIPKTNFVAGNTIGGEGIKFIRANLHLNAIVANAGTTYNQIAVPDCSNYDSSLVVHVPDDIVTTDTTCITQAQCKAIADRCLQLYHGRYSCPKLTGITKMVDTGYCDTSSDETDFLIKTPIANPILLVTKSVYCKDGAGTVASPYRVENHKKECIEFHFEASATVPINPCGSTDTDLFLHINCSGANCTFSCSYVACDLSTHTLYGGQFCVHNTVNNNPAIVTSLNTFFPYYDVNIKVETTLSTNISKWNQKRKRTCSNLENFSGLKHDYSATDASTNSDANYRIWAVVVYNTKNYCMTYETCEQVGVITNDTTFTSGVLLYNSAGYTCVPLVVSDTTPANNIMEYEFKNNLSAFKVGEKPSIHSYIKETECGTIGTKTFVTVVNQVNAVKSFHCQEYVAATHFYDEQRNYGLGAVANKWFRTQAFITAYKWYTRAAADDATDVNDTNYAGSQKTHPLDTGSTRYFFEQFGSTYHVQTGFTSATLFQHNASNYLITAVQCSLLNPKLIYSLNGTTKSCKTLTNYVAGEANLAAFVDIDTSLEITEANCVLQGKFKLYTATKYLGCVMADICLNAGYLLDLQQNKCITHTYCDATYYQKRVNTYKYCMTAAHCVDNRSGLTANQYVFSDSALDANNANTVYRACIPFNDCNAITNHAVNLTNFECTATAPASFKYNSTVRSENKWLKTCAVDNFVSGNVGASTCQRNNANARTGINNCATGGANYLGFSDLSCRTGGCDTDFTAGTENLLFKYLTGGQFCVTGPECLVIENNFAVFIDSTTPANSECKILDPRSHATKYMSKEGFVGTYTDCKNGLLFNNDFKQTSYHYIIVYDNPERINECRKRNKDLTFSCPSDTWKVTNALFSVTTDQEGCYDETAALRANLGVVLNQAKSAFTLTCQNTEVKTALDSTANPEVNRCTTRSSFKNDIATRFGTDAWFKTTNYAVLGTYTEQSIAVASGCEKAANLNFPVRNQLNECLTRAQCVNFQTNGYLFLQSATHTNKECLPTNSLCTGDLVRSWHDSKYECVAFNECTTAYVTEFGLNNFYWNFENTEILCKNTPACVQTYSTNNRCFTFATCNANNFYWKIAGNTFSCLSPTECTATDANTIPGTEGLFGLDNDGLKRCFTFNECIADEKRFVNPDKRECLNQVQCNNLCSGLSNCEVLFEGSYCFKKLVKELYYTAPKLAYDRKLKVYNESCNAEFKIFEEKRSCVLSCDNFTDSSGVYCFSKCEFCLMPLVYEKPLVCSNLKTLPSNYNFINYFGFNNQNDDCKLITQESFLPGYKRSCNEFFQCSNKVLRTGQNSYSCVSTCPKFTIDRGDFCAVCNDSCSAQLQPGLDKFYNGECVASVPLSAKLLDAKINGYVPCSELSNYAIDSNGTCVEKCSKLNHGKQNGVCTDVLTLPSGEFCIDNSNNTIITSAVCKSSGINECNNGYCLKIISCAANEFKQGENCVTCGLNNPFYLYKDQCIEKCPLNNGSELIIPRHPECVTCNQFDNALQYQASTDCCVVKINPANCQGTYDAATGKCNCTSELTGPNCDIQSLNGNTRARDLANELNQQISALSSIQIVTGGVSASKLCAWNTNAELIALLAVNTGRTDYINFNASITQLLNTTNKSCADASAEVPRSFSRNDATKYNSAVREAEKICNIANTIENILNKLNTRESERTDVIVSNRLSSGRRNLQSNSFENSIRGTIRTFLSLYISSSEKASEASVLKEQTYSYFTHPISGDAEKQNEYKTFLMANEGAYLNLNECFNEVANETVGTAIATFIEWISPARSGDLANEYEWAIFDSANGNKLDLSLICPGVEFSYIFPTSKLANIDQAQLTFYREAAGSNIYDPRSSFYNEKCLKYAKDGVDYTISLRRGIFPGSELFCGSDCRLGALNEQNYQECICVNNSSGISRLQPYEMSQNDTNDYLGSIITCHSLVGDWEEVRFSYVFWFFLGFGLFCLAYYILLLLMGTVQGAITHNPDKIRENNMLTQTPSVNVTKMTTNYNDVGGENSGRKEEKEADARLHLNNNPGQESGRELHSKNNSRNNEDDAIHQENEDSVGEPNQIKIEKDAEFQKIDLEYVALKESVENDKRGFITYVWDKIRNNNLLFSPMFSYSLLRPYHYRILELVSFVSLIALFNAILWFDNYSTELLGKEVDDVNSQIWGQFRYGWDIIIFSILWAHVFKVIFANLLMPSEVKAATLSEPISKQEKESIRGQYRKLFISKLPLLLSFLLITAGVATFSFYSCYVYASFYAHAGLNWFLRTIYSILIAFFIWQPTLAILSFVGKEFSRKLGIFRYIYFIARF